MSKIINGVASEYDMPMIYENKTMTNRLGNEEIFTRWQDPTIEQLQQENQQLKEKINTYENPEDLTLMFMYCDEKAKDKIKELKEVIEEVRTLHKNFCTKHGIIVFENNELIEFMNNLIDTLNKAKDNK